MSDFKKTFFFKWIGRWWAYYVSPFNMKQRESAACRKEKKRPVEQDVTTTLNGAWRATEEDNWQDDTDSAIMDFFKGLFQSLRAMTSFGL